MTELQTHEATGQTFREELADPVSAIATSMAKRKTKLAANRLPRVTVLVDTSTEWGRHLIRGITRYSQEQGPWSLSVEPRGRGDSMRLPQNWEGEGIIARIINEKLADDLRSRLAAVVNVSGIRLDADDFPRVTTDYDAVAELAAEHFLSRGFRRFAYVGPLSQPYVKRHASAFQDLITKQGSTLQTFNYSCESIASERWRRQHQRLEKWLDELEKPTAIFSWGVSASTQLLDVCRSNGIAVPDDVAVLAGDNDDLIAQTTIPPMSAVLNPSYQIGFRAARRLDQLMNGKTSNESVERIPPIEIVTRRSTDAFAIQDAELTVAVQFLREHAFSDISVNEIADAVPMTRRGLERKFKEWFGRTPLEEIRRLRIARVKELLATSDMPVSKIAAAAGFGTPEYLTTLFKKETGLTPLKFRANARY